MNENPAASDWAAARGEKWRAQLAGMEAMLTPVDEPLIRALRLDAPYQNRRYRMRRRRDDAGDPAPGAGGKRRSRLRYLASLDRIGSRSHAAR